MADKVWKSSQIGFHGGRRFFNGKRPISRKVQKMSRPRNRELGGPWRRAWLTVRQRWRRYIDISSYRVLVKCRPTAGWHNTDVNTYVAVHSHSFPAEPYPVRDDYLHHVYGNYSASTLWILHLASHTAFVSKRIRRDALSTHVRGYAVITVQRYIHYGYFIQEADMPVNELAVGW